MKKVLCLLLASVVALMVAGCSGSNTSTTSISNTNQTSETTVDSSSDIKYADESFITDTSKALETGWKKADELQFDDMDVYDDNFADAALEMMSAESDVIAKYRTATFKDKNLQELATNYLDALEDIKNALSESDTDPMNALLKTESPYNERSAVIKTLTEEYGLTVSDKYESDLSEIIKSATEDTLPVSEHEETGSGTFYVTTPSGTSEDGNVPILYFGEDDFLVSIGMEAWDFDGSRLTYIYLNGKEIETEQLADTQSSIGLEQGDIQEGENTVVAVQYDNDDPSGEIVTYKTASFEVRMK